MRQVTSRLGDEHLLDNDMSDKAIDKDPTVASGNYHGLDYSLFHMNLRKNAIERVSAYMGQTS